MSPNPMAGVLTRKEKRNTQSHIQGRGPQEDRGGDWSDESTR